MKYILSLLLLISIESLSIANHSKELLPNGSKTILKAMNDEIKRNLNNLTYEDYSKPYYIAYNLSDTKSHQILANLGALVMSQPDRNRGNTVRLMVGDYDLNDENFVDRTSQSNHNDGYLPLPLDDDYMAIRRSYWLMTNNVYKNAAELFKNKQQAMKNKGLSKRDLSAPDFSRETPQTFYGKPIKNKVDIAKLEQKARDLSLLFKDYPEITQSNVYIVYQNSTDYYVNSEGSEIVQPNIIYRIAVVAMAYSKENDMIGNFLTYHGNSLEEMPSHETMKKDIVKLAEFLKTQSRIEPFTDSYTGPVLVLDKAVPSVLFQKMFIRGNGLIASRLPLINDKIKGLYNPRNQTWENRFGNKVIDKNFSVYDIPNFGSYNGQKLSGNYSIDMQGIQPKDTLTLIEKGLLRNQLINRTPTSKQLNATGHSRTFLDMGITSTALSPSNILVKAENTVSIDKIKQQLISEAKDNGLSYAILVKPLETSANYSPLSFYKINLETGEENLLRAINSGKISTTNLNNVISCSNEQIVFNTLFNVSQVKSHSQPVLSGTPVSYITPNAVLLKDAVIQGINEPIQRDGTILDNPVSLEFKK